MPVLSFLTTTHFDHGAISQLQKSMDRNNIADKTKPTSPHNQASQQSGQQADYQEYKQVDDIQTELPWVSQVPILSGILECQGIKRQFASSIKLQHKIGGKYSLFIYYAVDVKAVAFTAYR